MASLLRSQHREPLCRGTALGGKYRKIPRPRLESHLASTDSRTRPAELQKVGFIGGPLEEQFALIAVT